MRDARVEKLADVLVTYSTNVRKSDLVLILGPPPATPLAVALYRRVLAAGAHPVLHLQPEECREILLTEGQDHQLEYEDPLAQYQVENVDVILNLWAPENTKALSRVPPERQARLSQSRRKYLATFLQRAAEGALRWVGTQFPCLASAQDAEMSLSHYEDFVFHAGLLDEDNPSAAWQQLSTHQQQLAEFLNRCREVRFVTPHGTDLTVGVEGRRWINCDGHENFPDGEVFTGPWENATRGVVCFSFPAVHGGREVDGIRLEFRDGQVVDAAATKGEAFLHAMLDQDPGARRLGEIAIGTNYSIRNYTKNTLFDEKIGGTFHAAVGAAYPETGGQNQSGLHWDMVCDLRQGGQILADGELLSENGRFRDPSFPQPSVPR